MDKKKPANKTQINTAQISFDQIVGALLAVPHKKKKKDQQSKKKKG